jgi:hypothetical protein
MIALAATRRQYATQLRVVNWRTHFANAGSRAHLLLGLPNGLRAIHCRLCALGITATFCPRTSD